MNFLLGTELLYCTGSSPPVSLYICSKGVQTFEQPENSDNGMGGW